MGHMLFQGLIVMVLGMVGVFLFLFLLIAAMKLLVWACPYKAEAVAPAAPAQKAAAKKPAAESDVPVVLAAAVAADESARTRVG